MIGTVILSFMGEGKTSIVIATAAPTNAINGGTKRHPPKKAKKNPDSVPSHVFPLLNGKASETDPPKSDAVLSPKQNIAMAAAPAVVGKSISVEVIPNAKYSGAAAKPYSSEVDAAFRVI